MKFSASYWLILRNKYSVKFKGLHCLQSHIKIIAVQTEHTEVCHLMQHTGEKALLSVGPSSQQSMAVVPVVEYNQCAYVQFVKLITD